MYKSPQSHKSYFPRTRDKLCLNIVESVDAVLLKVSIDVGHLASSLSAGSQPFFFSEDHPLISTLRGRPGAVGWDKMYIDNLKGVLPLYNLEDLFTHVNFTSDSRERFSLKIEASGTGGTHGSHSVAWVSSLI